MKRLTVYLSIILLSCTNAPAPMLPVVEQKPHVDTAMVLLDMGLKRVGLIIEAQEKDVAMHEAYERFLQQRIEVNRRAVHEASDAYDHAYNRYDSLNKIYQRLYSSYYRKDLAINQQTK